jgi:putative zinc finger protein
MKREPMGNERDPDSWLSTTLRQTPPTASGACLDAETLAAWADNGLSATEAAAVELHTSSCSRCTAVLAALERSAPAASTTHLWTPARLFRWLAPLAAAATAVAIWIAVPDRPLTQVAPAPAHDMASRAPETPNPEPGHRTLEPEAPSPERRTLSAEPGTANRNPAPGTQNPEPQTQFAPSVRVEKPAAEEQLRMRDELRRESAAPQALGAEADTAAKAPTTAASAPAAPAPTATPSAMARSAPPGAASADAVAKTLTANERTAFMSKVMASESVSPSNPLMRWRVVEFASVERSTDGGKKWAKTSPPPGVAPNNTPAVTVVAIRAVDGDRAVARTSNGVEFYTSNAGRSWTRVQENSAAPF